MRTSARRRLGRPAILLALLLTLVSGWRTSLAADEQQSAFASAEIPGASLRFINGLPVITLEGAPEELGRRQGELLKEYIGPLLEAPRKVLTDAGLNYSLLLPVASAAARTMAANAPERYRQELDALAEAGGFDPGVLYVGNCLVELRRMGGCSAFVVAPDRSATGELMFGRNFDFPTFDVLDKYSCVLIVKPEGRHAFASIAVPGFVGVVSGINDAGLALATLDVYDSADGSPMFNLQGAPLALTYRQILEECTTVDEARKLLEATPRTTYMNLAVADRETAAILELTPGRVGVRSPQEGVLRCTNHFELPELSVGIRCLRYYTLGKLIEFRRGEPLTRQDVHRALHAVNQGPLTFQTMIFEPRSLTLHVAFGPGPVSDKPLHQLDLAPLFEAAEPYAASVGR